MQTYDRNPGATLAAWDRGAALTVGDVPARPPRSRRRLPGRRRRRQGSGVQRPGSYRGFTPAGPDDARHRGRGKGLPEHRLAGPEQRPDARPDRRGDAGTRQPRRAPAGYRPNPLARGLRGASTMLIGAVVRDFSDPFFAGAIEALAVEAMAHGYNIVLGHAQGRLDEGIALTTVLETRHTDAIVLLGDMQDQPRLLDDLRGRRSRSSPCGRARARSSSRPPTPTTAPASWPVSTTSSTSATRGSPSSAPTCRATSASARTPTSSS